MKRALLVLALPLAACGAGERPPNVLLITLDTLRADRLGCYGNPRGLTPSLDALARQATRWEACASAAPWTVPSHASLFTGLPPHAHGAVSFLVTDTSLDNVYTLAQEHLTLAEALGEAGYQTAGIVANAVYLNASFGLDQGFDTWRIARERAPRLNLEALRWLDGRDEGRPWLLFLNYMDVHRPYNVEPLGDEERFGPEEFSSELLDRLYRRVIIRGEEPGPLAERLQEQYDRAVRNLDRALGELFDALRERGLWEDTVVVVTSDHGEYFGEHGLVEHSKDVYEEALAVPLLVKGAGQRAGRVETARVSGAHLPRVLAAVLPQALGARLAGDFPAGPGDPIVSENYYSRLRDVLDPRVGERFHRERAVLYDGPWKAIRSSDGKHELYHLERDPHELEDLAAREPERLARMIAEVEARRAAAPPPASRGTVRVDLQHAAGLEAMGYGGDAGDEDEDEDEDGG